MEINPDHQNSWPLAKSKVVFVVLYSATAWRMLTKFKMKKLGANCYQISWVV